MGEVSNSRRCVNRKSGQRGCLFCHNFKPSNFFTSTVTHRTYPILNHEYPMPMDCKSKNLIYLITCSTCHLQYVGETSQQLNIRFQQHRSGMAGNQGSHACCRRICDHWTKGKCKDSHFNVQIIEKLKGNGRNGSKIDLGIAVERRKRETFWIRKLRTAYPYGLNDRIGDDFVKVDCEREAVGPYFLKSDRKLPRTKDCRHSRKNKCLYNAEDFLKDLDMKIEVDIPNVPNFIRINITSMKKIQLRKVFNGLHNKLAELGENFQYTHWYLMACDTIESKIYKAPKEIIRKRTSKYKLVIPFDNKSFDFLNLPQIIQSKELKQHMPSKMLDEDIPMVVYSLTESIRSKILNYGEFVDQLDLNEFNNNKDSVPCPCSEFERKYINDHHKHVLTGDLSIIKNNDLRKLFNKGPKYREPKEIKFETAKELIKSTLNKFIEKIKYDKIKDDKGIIDLTNWKNQILEKVDVKIQQIGKDFKKRNIKSVLKDKKVKQDLNKLLEIFVTVPIDKAQNNIAFVCKKLYAEILLSELNSNTYEQTNKDSKNNIISNHVNYLSSLKLKVEEKFRQLPRIYWTPKMHKTPVGTRFIIGNPCSSLKPLSKDITAICKLFFGLHTRYYEKTQYLTGINYFWIVQNNNQLLENIDKINKRGNAKIISTFDFSSLYTNIPHDKLLTVLNEIVDFAFNGGTSKYVSVTKGGAHFVKYTNNSKQYYYNKNKIKDSIKFLLQNCHFTIGKSVFRQKIGIPMGSDPAPFFANFFLFHYESIWMKNLKKKNQGRARKFGNICRFIDDLIAINDGNEFLNSFCDIYPPELQLNKENDSEHHATFLDMDIQIIDRKFVTKLYDKRDSYNFDIVRLPYKNSNMPSKMFYNTIGAEILRICRATSQYVDFKSSTTVLLKRMTNQGSIADGTKKVLSNTMTRHWKAFSKYNITSTNIINDLLPPKIKDVSNTNSNIIAK